MVIFHSYVNLPEGNVFKEFMESQTPQITDFSESYLNYL